MIKPGDEPIAGYRVEELLGHGQFGQVWRARSPGNTHLALKFMELSGAHGWKEFRAIQRVKQIRHVHLMPIVALWLLDEHGNVISDEVIDSIAASHHESATDSMVNKTMVTTDTISMARRPSQLVVATLLANKSLGDRLRARRSEGRRGIEVDELLRYMDEAAKGLDFLNSAQHQIGDSLGAVQHCDVKPDNIMLTGGSVVIADFGVAQVLAQSRRDVAATSLGGTPAYMAPECFQYKPSSTSDQYSLAVTYFELRTGKLPFVEETYAAVYAAHQGGTLDFSAVGPAERQVLERATALNPEERYASCAAFVDALHDAVHTASESAPTHGLRRWAAAAVALAAFALAAGVGLTMAYWRPPTPTPPTTRITIVVDPPDAVATLDGAPLKLDANGRTTFEAEIGKTLTLKAAKSPDRQEKSLEIRPQQNGAEHKLVLPMAAPQLADDADRLLADGRFPEAVEALRQAIVIAPERYAILPQPIMRTGGDSIRLMKGSPSGRRLVFAAPDGEVRQWSIDGETISEQGGAVHRHAGELRSLAVDESYSATVASDGESESIMVSRDGGAPQALSPGENAGAIKDIAIVGDRWLVAACELIAWLAPMQRITTIHVWDLQSNDAAATHREALKLDDEYEPSLAASHKASWIVLATTSTVQDASVVRQCWLDADRTRVVHQQSEQIVPITISNDDRLIAVGGGAVDDDDDAAEGDCRATLIDAQSGEAQIMGRGHYDSISAVAFDSAGRELLTGDVQGDVQLWSWTAVDEFPPRLSSAPLFLLGGKAAVALLAVPQPGWVAACYDGKAALWYCLDGKPMPLWLGGVEARVMAMFVTPDGRWIITGDRDGKLCFWPAQKLMLVHQACAAAGVTPIEPKATPDQITRRDRPRPSARHSLWESAGSGRRPVLRPSAVLGG